MLNVVSSCGLSLLKEPYFYLILLLWISCFGDSFFLFEIDYIITAIEYIDDLGVVVFILISFAVQGLAGIYGRRN